MRFSRLTGDRDNRPRTVDEDLLALLRNPRVTQCSPCSSLAGLPNKCTHRAIEAYSPAIGDGNGRKASNVVAHGPFVVLDLDHLSESDAHAVDARAEALGWCYTIHSTHSHNPAQNDWCLRLVVYTTREQTPAEVTPTREWVQAQLGIRADEQTKDLFRIYYLPSRPVDGPPYVYGHAEGSLIEPVAFFKSALPSVAETHSPAPVPVQVGAPVLSDGPIDIKALRATLGRGQHALVRLMLNAEPLAGTGGRDNAIHLLANHLVWTYYHIPLEVWAEMMRPSLDAMEPPESGTWHAIAWAKLQAQHERCTDQRKVKAAMHDAGVRAMGQEVNKATPIEDGVTESDRDPNSGAKYSNELMERWASDAATTPEGFKKRWVIRHKGGNWVFCNGRYSGVLTDQDLPYSLERDLSRAPVQLLTEDKEGNSKPRHYQTVLQEYSTVARGCEASLSLQKSYYDAERQVFHEAVCPIRTDIGPEFNQEIDHWLRLFGGEALLDWVAVVTRLDLPAAAMYISAPPGTGKNVLANGLARLWHKGGASSFVNVIGSNFNDALTRCPLIFADEGIPRTNTVMEDLRALIGSDVRDLNRKFMPVISITGCPRLLITANNDRVLLDTGSELGPDDIEAVTQRVRHIQADKQSVAYLANLRETKGYSYVQSWVLDDKLAKHSLWLLEHRTVDMTGRFLVSGTDREQAERMTTNTGHVSSVMEFLVRQLSDTSAVQTARIRAGGGQLLVNTEALLNENIWKLYVPSRKVPPARVMSESLRSVSESDTVEVAGLYYFQVKPHMVLNWARKNQVGSPAIIEGKINAVNGP